MACGLLWAFDIPSRVIGLKTRDVETRKYGAGHVVIEFWSLDYGKWIMCDVQAGLIPFNQRKPLAACELSELVASSAIINYESVTGSKTSIDSEYDGKLTYTAGLKNIYIS